MFSSNGQALAIIGGVAAIFDISWRRAAKGSRIRQILSAFNCRYLGPNTR